MSPHRNGHAGQFQDAGEPQLQSVFEGCARVASHRSPSWSRNSKKTFLERTRPSFVTSVARCRTPTGTLNGAKWTLC